MRPSSDWCSTAPWMLGEARVPGLRNVCVRLSSFRLGTSRIVYQRRFSIPTPLIGDIVLYIHLIKRSRDSAFWKSWLVFNLVSSRARARLEYKQYIAISTHDLP